MLDVRTYGYAEGTFKLGQKLYHIEDVTHRFWFRKKCAYCDNTGKVLIKGKEFQCPNCGGRQELKEVVERIISPTTIKVESIRVFKNKDVTLESYTNDSSGLGIIIQKQKDGSSRYFGTQEEAQLSCDEYNRKHSVYVLLDEYKRHEIRDELT